MKNITVLVRSLLSTSLSSKEKFYCIKALKNCKIQGVIMQYFKKSLGKCSNKKIVQ